MLQLKIQDIRRATLPVRSGNEGWIGVSPNGDAYHVVVPVDVQIARGVMACNKPSDGTPFGGYSGWLYFRCPPYEDESVDEERTREDQVLQTAASLVRFLKSYEIQSELVMEAAPGDSELDSGDMPPTETAWADRSSRISQRESGKLWCQACGKTWTNLAQFLRDPGLKLSRYKACVEDFNKGAYEFSHSCGSSVGVPAARFIKSRSCGKSLVGSHACPGLCYYDSSLLSCSAVCEGSPYRRIADRLAVRNGKKT
ncbi:MAG: hypothetical protein HY912_11335 [Desulfomonile tiedjei]|uniref:Uncharacterized protein n=1 Tax=Desulfomonile tiedjei TaxID=2358 RepID=A0A9D6V3R6_9BACT|nr:hypothetical protein [Desulfomonile tiedjei]